MIVGPAGFMHAPMKKPKVISQGKIIVEKHEDEFLILWPDGQVEVTLDKAEAEKRIKTWAKKSLGRGYKLGIATVEWRNL